MSTYTQNLNLFKYDVVADRKAPYNIIECLNNNWDKLDTSYGNILNKVTQQINILYDKIQPIGQPIIRLDNTLFENEVRLEGATVLIVDYPNLYEIYKNIYGQVDKGYFKLPDFRNRAIWGASDFGYLTAGLPNILAKWNSVNDGYGTGAIYRSGSWGNFTDFDDGGGWGTASNLEFNASKSNSIYGASSTVQPPAIKVRVVTRFK